MECIPNNEEKYIYSKEIVIGKYIDKKDGKEKESKREIRFLDSFGFMQYSPAKLVSYLSRDSFNNLSTSYYGEGFDLLVRKGVFPYEWFNRFDKLNATELPAKEAFYSKLTYKHISDDDYAHAQKVWKTFIMKTMRDYHDLYMKSDVLLLADVFESFRNVCMKYYGLDPVFYTFTSLGCYVKDDQGQVRTSD